MDDQGVVESKRESDRLLVTREMLAEYRVTARRLQEREQADLEKRRARAWKAARRAAALLKEQFGATRVVVFGSLIHNESFTPWSDVDIAAWGIAPLNTFRAIGAVLDGDAEIEVNLVDVNACRPGVLAVIEREGVDL